MTTQEQHYRHSSYREKLLEHLFLAELLQVGWFRNPERRIEVVRSEVDDSGYDLLLEYEGRRRYVQLKSNKKATAPDVNVQLGNKEGGCVVIIVVEEPGENSTQRYELTYRFFGARVPEKRPALGGEIGGRKRNNPNKRRVYLKWFDPACNVTELFDKLFPGIQPGCH